MASAELLVDAVGRIREVVHQAVDGRTPEQLVPCQATFARFMMRPRRWS
jgi:hypothetical protein